MYPFQIMIGNRSRNLCKNFFNQYFEAPPFRQALPTDDEVLSIIVMHTRHLRGRRRRNERISVRLEYLFVPYQSSLNCFYNC